MSRHRVPPLPSKVCPVCQRAFAWRKRWARDWEQVIYCSDACRKRTPRGRCATLEPALPRRR
ncbi:MAG TPA: DUF2256 domain-containing protein [Aquimonas sp.]|nr:DUF2256 domain-containing protein [Xanthomonadales bacterium]HRD73347.1 DUF2256 domain-containing protein [Aquimonas sp.]HRF53401.1 DUF2256 domain-containing protein [Aquimonas sp.]